MPGGYGTDESTPWGSSGDTGASWNTSSSSGSGSSGNGGGWSPSAGRDESGYLPDHSSYSENESNNVNTDIYQEMADSMAAAGQISGGLSGGTYTKGPVVYPKEFYTHEGWAEVQRKGWSDKLKPQFQFAGQYSITDDEMDQYGRFQTLPEGIIYSSNIGDPESGYGGFIRTSEFDSGTGGGSGAPGGYYGWPGWGGSNVNYGNPMGRFSEWGRRPFMKQNFDSPVAAALQQKIYGDRHPPQPINQRLFIDRVAGRNKGGIMGVRK
jgi:hypothetical protein